LREREADQEAVSQKRVVAQPRQYLSEGDSADLERQIASMRIVLRHHLQT
jgi:hypothetical protein